MRTARRTREDRSPPMTSLTFPPITCNQPDDVAEVKALDDFRLHVRFYDGLEGEVDLSARVRSPHAGVFAQLADPARFAKAYVEYGAVTWPGEIDLAPDTTYEEIKQHGKWTLS